MVKKIICYLILVLVILCIVLGGFFLIKNKKEKTIYGDVALTDAPTCVVLPPYYKEIREGATSTLVFDCYSTAKFTKTVLTSSSFVPSVADLVSVSAPIKESLENGIRYILTVTAKKEGVVNISLKPGLIKTSSGKINKTVTSESIIVDNTAPKVKFSKQGGNYTSDQDIVIEASDNASGFRSMDIHILKNGVYDDSKSVNAYKENKYSVKLEKGYLWSINAIVYDKAGNTQNQIPMNDYGWYYQDYDLTSLPNLIYGLNNVNNVGNKNDNGIYSVNNGVVTVTARNDDGYVVTNGKVKLEANKKYRFKVDTNGVWGSANDTVEAFLLKDGKTDKFYHMYSNNYEFTVDVSSEYSLRFDVNQKGKKYSFSNIKIVEIGNVQGSTNNNDDKLNNKKNLIENLEDFSNEEHELKNGRLTIKASKDDGYVYTRLRVKLEKNKKYLFNVETDGKWGGDQDTVEAFLMLDGKTTKYYHMLSNKYEFMVDTSGEYHLRFDVNKKGKEYSFWNIKIVESEGASNNEQPPKQEGSSGGAAVGGEEEKDPTDYAFKYGMNSLIATLLTNFKDGIKGSGDGNFVFNADGLLINVNTSKYADSYNIYSGANLLNAHYNNVEYIGVELKNNESHNIMFGLQGTDKNNKNIFISVTGKDILLASNIGNVYIATGKKDLYSRYCIDIPANFDGVILIPANRITDINNGENGNWNKAPIEKVGVFIYDPLSSGKGELIKSIFIYKKELKIPEIKDNYTEENRIAPFWKIDTMYNESLAMIEDSNNNIYGTLLFEPIEVISVKDNSLQVEYINGKDYVVEGNKIKFVQGSRIKYFTEKVLSGHKENGEQLPYYDGNNNTVLSGRLYTTDKNLYEKQIAVTYKYNKNDVSKIKYTNYQGSNLSKTINKLRSNNDLNITFYGDSIFFGCDASGLYSQNRYPFQPTMDVLIQNELQRQKKTNGYSGKVNMTNLSIGGWGVQDGNNALSGPTYVTGCDINQSNNCYNDYSNKYNNVDLLILSFGMNNKDMGEAEYKNNISEIIRKVKAKNPNVEVILVSCMNPNPKAFGLDINQKYHGKWLGEIAKDGGYALVDFYQIHKSILNYKNFVSTSGNNINHPNDWLIRVYAQNILATMLDYNKLYK